MLLSAAIEEFILDQRVKGNSRKTLIYYEQNLATFRVFLGERSLDDITLSDCRLYYDYIAGKNILSISVQSNIRAVRAFLKWCWINEYMSIDLCRRFRLPKAKQTVIDVLTDEEIQKIYAFYSGDTFHQRRNLAMFALMLDSGLRLGEVVSARRDKLRLPDFALIVHGKGNKERTVGFGENTARILSRYLELCPAADYLFLKTDENGNFLPITEHTVRDVFKVLKKYSGVPRIHPHLLRHTFATRYLQNGGNLMTLQMLLGHTSLEMVKHYLHLALSRSQKEFVSFSPLDRLMQGPD